MKNKFEIRGTVTAIFLHRRKAKETIETLIDTTDLPLAQSMLLTWYAWWAPDSKTFYVRNRLGEMLHRRVVCCPDSLDVDHRDHNGLNNQRENLFPTTKSKNRLNQAKVQQGTKSGLRGVTKDSGGQWRARVTVNGKETYLGYFKYKEDASEVVENFLLITLGKQRYQNTTA